MIRLENLSLTINGRKVIGPLDLRIEDGNWVVLAGGNGSGKSTLCRLAAGLREPTEGNLFVDSKTAVTTGIAMQNPDSQFITTTVEREILFGMENLKLSAIEKKRRFNEAAAAFALKGLVTRNPHTLSGGEKQRLLLASVWVLNPGHLILDEPLSFLDSAEKDNFIKLVEDLFYKRKITVLWATLSPDETPRANRVVYLREGRVFFDGTPEDFKDIGSEDLIAGVSSGPAEKKLYRRDKSPELEAGTGIEDVVNIKEAVISPGEGDFLLRIEDLCIKKGEAVGITGPNGSGKTTLLMACAGLLSARKGRVEVLGKDVSSAGDFQPGRVAVLFQSPEEAFFSPSVQEEVSLGYRSFKGNNGSTEAVKRALETVGLEYDSFRERNPFHLSQGEKRLCAIASVLVFRAQLYLFDEPALFLDGNSRRRLISALGSFKDSKETTSVIVSHEWEFLDAVTERVIQL
ncbi:MAG: ABC transporter ATP-binding protein [Candidatus Krumholzibacteriota bacterium]|nr:ABC transporter ATP-binding protein [Candidatus Krumholzibacteriota bacterium]